eukprot:COSAG04_NODE_679_length_11197_cov_43.956584_1_plen_428_part_00
MPAVGWVTPILTLLLASAAGLAAGAATIHVSAPTGSDTAGNGSEARPFATLQRAQVAARAAGSGAVVVVDAAVYCVPSPMVFTAADSGTTYRGPGPSWGPAGGPPGATVYGGVTVPPRRWERVPGSSIWRADLRGVLPSADSETGTGVRPFFNLIEAGVGATLAQTPDKGSGYLSLLNCSNNKTALSCPPGVLPPSQVLAAELADMSIKYGTGNNWDSNSIAVSAVAQEAAPKFPRGRQAGRAGNTTVEFSGGPCNDRVMIQGSKTFISEPGEWALASAASMLYLWPRDERPMRSGTASVVAATTPTIFEIRGESFLGSLARNLTFEGLNLIGSDFSRTWSGPGDSDGRYPWLNCKESCAGANNAATACMSPPGWRRTSCMQNSAKPSQQIGMVRVENATDIRITGCRLGDAGYSAVFIEGFAQRVR